MNDKLVTLLKFNDITQANMIKSILESNNIYCILNDDNISQIHPDLTRSIGLIKLIIKESDYESSISILKEHNVEFNEFKKYDNITAPPCNKCHSRKVYAKPMSLPYIIFGTLFLFIPIINRVKTWRCYDCNYSWEDKFSFGKLFISIIFALLLLALINGVIIKIY